MSEKTFVIHFKGEIEADELESVIYRGLQHYEDIEWESYNAKEKE